MQNAGGVHAVLHAQPIWFRLIADFSLRFCYTLPTVQSDAVKKFQRKLNTEFHSRVMQVALTKRMEDFRLEGAIEDLVYLGMMHPGHDKVIRKPWLSVLGGRIDFRLTRAGSIISVAVLSRYARVTRNAECDLMCERFIRFANLCAARMWTHCHRHSGLVIPDNKLLLLRDQLNDDAEKESGLNELVDWLEAAFKSEGLEGSVNEANRGRPVTRMTKTDAELIRQQFSLENIKLSEKLEIHREELNRLHQEITKLNARLDLVLHTSSVNQ